MFVEEYAVDLPAIPRLPHFELLGALVAGPLGERVTEFLLEVTRD
ncbi:uncharacterized protein HHUB_4121 (plasmid) [Halobacterium hubeiense]|uniref:Uncharacterized protein n=1 Tax=Halobacterium hubeiense TaxID=1407499 RepID=A0A0U5AJI5_9EURY|nr:uncharacterized protein HHUB_4121 [Halobacterium hubeiense]